MITLGGSSDHLRDTESASSSSAPWRAAPPDSSRAPGTLSLTTTGATGAALLLERRQRRLQRRRRRHDHGGRLALSSSDGVNQSATFTNYTISSAGDLIFVDPVDGDRRFQQHRGERRVQQPRQRHVGKRAHAQRQRLRPHRRGPDRGRRDHELQSRQRLELDDHRQFDRHQPQPQPFLGRVLGAGDGRFQDADGDQLHRDRRQPDLQCAACRQQSRRRPARHQRRSGDGLDEDLHQHPLARRGERRQFRQAAERADHRHRQWRLDRAGRLHARRAGAVGRLHLYACRRRTAANSWSAARG